MAEPIEFYFDFISPFGYLGSQRIDEVAVRFDRDVIWRPMLLGVSVMQVMGIKPLMETPLKSDYLLNDMKRMARLDGIDLKLGHLMDMKPLPPARAYTWLFQQSPDLAKRFAKAVYRAHWGEGRSINTVEALAEEAEKLGIDGRAMIAGIDDPETKQQLRNDIDASLARGVFGSPTYIVDGEMFWGSDRLPMVEKWLETGGW